ncbi:hypothetical protein A3L09_00570 [Thermococcus profundus]|uniref:D-glutamate cyclase-like C-terminal domain-containing protein n=1 Tax=Thermococcus profundus TaxID=49899 RepID=A0A2Z2MIS5_THEPR|nr:glutamate cyclase domain-containing protein [Thermococcus profundus]ASJ01858.1 hypothetical protein A3L09_00570 [Thermococcus profundus]
MIAHLINTDVGKRGVLPLYLDYRREKFSFLRDSATLFLDNLDRVLIVTGFPIPPGMIPETDGPPGALAVAKAVRRLGGKAEILTYPEVKKALEPFGVEFAEDPDPYNYSLIIGVETPGRGIDGRARSMSGRIIERELFDGIFLEAREAGVPTIGIGDGGNEAGMGRIRDLVSRHIPLGERIASMVETDELVLSAVSNWGAYGLLGQASIEVGKDLLEGWDERTVVTAMTEAGLIDGVTRRVEASVDGISLNLHIRMVELLKGIVSEAIG